MYPTIIFIIEPCYSMFLQYQIAQSFTVLTVSWHRYIQKLNVEYFLLSLDNNQYACLVITKDDVKINCNLKYNAINCIKKLKLIIKSIKNYLCSYLF